jgi:heme a synthase
MTTPPSPALPEEPRSELRRHRYALLVAAATVVLLAAGGLVTSTGSGLAVPDWPLSFGQVFPPMVGGVLFEHGHRMVAASVGLLTIGLALWFQRRERRAWVRRLAWAALALVVAQGVLGGVTVLLRLPAAVSVAHACLAQAFFCVVVTLVLVTSPRRAALSGGSGAGDRAVPGIATAGAITAALVYAQLILGAVMRHTGAGLAIPDLPLAFGRLVPPLLSFEIAVHFAHRVGALIVAAAVVTLAVKVARQAPRRPDLIRPARAAVVLVALQILLGAATVATRLAVLPATAHVVVGALLLAACLTTAVRAALGTRARERTAPAGATVAGQPA